MTFYVKIFLVLSIHFWKHVESQFAPTATLYSSIDGTGSYQTIHTGREGIKNLEELGFNRARSACLLGTWLFYQNPDFNTNSSDTIMEYIFEGGQETCVNFKQLSGKVSSVRFAGSEDDYRKDTITFYASPYFQGEAEYVVIDLLEIRLLGNVSSLIISGSSDWTIYDDVDYGGRAFCLRVTPSKDFAPAFVADTVDLQPTVPHGAIASVRRGCYSNQILAIRTLQRKSRLNRSRNDNSLNF